MASRTDLDLKVFDYGADPQYIATGALNLGLWIISWVNLFFHCILGTLINYHLYYYHASPDPFCQSGATNPVILKTLYWAKGPPFGP